MSSTNYTRWWRDGSIAATKNSNEVVGTSTYWATTNINPGDIMKINGVDYEVQKVTDDTHITLATPYTGETGSGLAYAIVRNFTSTTNAKVAAQTSELMYDFARFIDHERSTITGKSAYELAKDNGFTGTEAQWLESLKAAGEWSNANSRLAALEGNVTTFTYIKALYEASQYSVEAKTILHKQIYRGKNLGPAPTEAQYAAIRNGTYDDIFLGDYWEFPMNITFPLLNEADPENGDTWVNETEPTVFNKTVKWTIVDIGRLVETGANQKDPYTGENLPYANTRNTRNVVLMPNCSFGNFPMNYKNSNECGYLYSLVNTKIFPAIYDAIKDIFNLRAFCLSVWRSSDAHGSQCQYLFLPSRRELNEWSGEVAGYNDYVVNPHYSKGEERPFALYNITNPCSIFCWGWTRDIAKNGASKRTDSFATFAGWAGTSGSYRCTTKAPVYPFVVLW